MEGGEPLAPDKQRPYDTGRMSDLVIASLNPGEGQRAGAKPGDVFVAVAGKVVKGASMDDFRKELRKAALATKPVSYECLLARPVDRCVMRRVVVVLVLCCAVLHMRACTVICFPAESGRVDANNECGTDQ